MAIKWRARYPKENVSKIWYFIHRQIPTTTQFSKKRSTKNITIGVILFFLHHESFQSNCNMGEIL